MTARERELKACESFEEFIDEATVSVYLSEEDREVLEGNLLPLWDALNTRAADPRIAELEVENARLDKQNANLDSLLSSSIKLSDKHEAVNCDLHLRVEKLEAENAMLKQKLDESDALFHASLTGQSNALEEVEKLEGLLRECLGELMAVPRANRCNDDSMQDVIKRTTAALGGVTTRESKNA